MKQSAFAALLISALLSGCAQTAVLRVVEYSGDGFLGAVQGRGVAVHQSGGDAAFAQVEIVYRGTHSDVVVRFDK